jgi:hypothetical protein
MDRFVKGELPRETELRDAKEFEQYQKAGEEDVLLRS